MEYNREQNKDNLDEKNEKKLGLCMCIAARPILCQSTIIRTYGHMDPSVDFQTWKFRETRSNEQSSASKRIAIAKTHLN